MTTSDAVSILEKIPENPGQSILLGLAVIGGGVIGGFLTGLAFQGATKLSTGQNLPRWAVNFMRAIGGMGSALMLALMLFTEPGGGGPGPGGPGQGEGTGPGNTLVSTQPKDTPQPNKDKPPEPPREAKPLRVEVVDPGDKSERWYRLEGEAAKRYTLKEVTDIISERKKADPPLKAVVVVLTNPESPGKRTGRVTDLTRWVEEDAKLKLSLELPGAPDPK